MAARRTKRGSAKPQRERSAEKAHASPPNVFDDPAKRPPSGAVPWKMWPRGKHMDAETFWHQSWYGARALAAAHFGVSREHIEWEIHGQAE
jgi:hypothetical protein